MVFLDASAIIYLLEGEPGIRRAAQHTVASLAEQGTAPGVVVSSLSLLECRVHPMRSDNDQRLNAFDAFFDDAGLVIVGLDRKVIDRATRLRAKHGIRTPDALQAASCLEVDSEMPFVTGDRDFSRVPVLNVHLIE